MYNARVSRRFLVLVQLFRTKKQAKMPDRIMCFTMIEEQHCFELQATRFVAGSLSAFTLVDNYNFVTLWQMLRPGSLPPKRELVANNLLNEVFAQKVENASKKFSNEQSTLSIDGWSSIISTPVLGVSVTIQTSRTLFSHAIDTTGTPQTSENLLK